MREFVDMFVGKDDDVGEDEMDDSVTYTGEKGN
jgi:hypothetical protein